MSFFKRLEGVFFSPRATFEGLAEKPVWSDELILVLVALVVVNSITRPYLQKDQISMMKDHAVSLKERYGEDQYARMLGGAENPSSAAFIIQTLIMPALFFIAAILLQSLFLFIGGRMLSTQGTFVKVLSVLVHANLIDK